MTRAWILMTAMPPTKGHMNLIRFGASLNVDEVKVIVCTQPDEPFFLERFRAVRSAVKKIQHVAGEVSPVSVKHLHRKLEQNPDTEGFWGMWDAIMDSYGALPGDYYVTSELYGATLATRLKGKFMPYDPNRELYYTKATNIRENMLDYFHDILPEFQDNLRSTVTVFGAESTGKTTLSHLLADEVNGHWIFEWARPYLETVGPEITKASMNDIWQGQKATQVHARMMKDKPFIIQDTDLFSTVGYWAQPHWETDLGPVPQGLINDAIKYKSDLYIITKSNIDFEEDPIRYGGDHRESPDEYWIALCERYDLNYVVLHESELDERLKEAHKYARHNNARKARSIYYDRLGN